MNQGQAKEVIVNDLRLVSGFFYFTFIVSECQNVLFLHILYSHHYFGGYTYIFFYIIPVSVQNFKRKNAFIKQVLCFVFSHRMQNV